MSPVILIAASYWVLGSLPCGAGTFGAGGMLFSAASACCLAVSTCFLPPCASVTVFLSSASSALDAVTIALTSSSDFLAISANALASLPAGGVAGGLPVPAAGAAPPAGAAP